MIRGVFFSLFLLLLNSSVVCQENIKNKSYSALFNDAKLLISNQKPSEAIPLLEELYNRDKSNSNAAYLLSLCYVKSVKRIDNAIKLLEIAKEDYSKFYNKTSFKEKAVSEYAYYYLTIAYSLIGNCEKTLETLNDFYKVYSYEDEWYLVNAQKWHRECGQHKWEKDTLVDSTFEQSNTSLIDTNSNQSEIDSSSKVIAQKAKHHDRLKRVNDFQGQEVMTRPVNYHVKITLYGVQVGAFIKPRFTSDFKNLKNVEAYIDNNGVFRYVIGRFVHKSQSEKLLTHVKEQGYKDAFIVDINSNDKFEEEVVRINHQSIKRKISGQVKFCIQIGAFKEDSIPKEIMKIYMQFDDIKQHFQKDLTVITLGEYVNFDVAKAYCNNIKEMGVKDAFVVAYNKGKKISIEEANSYLARKRELEFEKEQLEPKSSDKKRK